MAQLFSDAKDTEGKIIKAKQKKNICWYAYKKSYENKIIKICFKTGIVEKTAKSQIYAMICEDLLSCCLITSTKVNVQGFFPLLSFTRAYPTVDSRDYRKLVNLEIELVYPSCCPKSQRIRVSQLTPNLAT